MKHNELNLKGIERVDEVRIHPYRIAISCSSLDASGDDDSHLRHVAFDHWKVKHRVDLTSIHLVKNVIDLD